MGIVQEEGEEGGEEAEVSAVEQMETRKSKVVKSGRNNADDQQLVIKTSEELEIVNSFD